MEHKTLTGDRGTVHYWVGGALDETIVFTHGATMDHDLFRHQTDHFSRRYRVFTWDVPLHGLSRPYRDFSLQHAADDLIAILDVEDIPRAHLVGQSMGGYISQVAAQRYPDRARSLVAVDASPIHLTYYSGLDRWLLSITPFLLKLYPYHYLIRTIAKGIALDRSAQEYALAVLQTYTITEIAEIMRDVYQGLLSQEGSPRFACPVLIMYGEKDTTGKVRQYSDRWAELENLEVRIIPGAAHNSNMDNPAEFNTALEQFLEQTRSSEA